MADERPYVRSRGRVPVDGDGVVIAPATAAAQSTANTALAAIQAAVEGATPAGANHIGEVGGRIANPSANFTRPNDTTAYAVGDLVANSTTAGSVTPLSWTAARVATGSFMVRRVRLKKSGTTATSGSFRIHLYETSPTVTNGDNGAWLSIHAGYLGYFDLTVVAFSDACAAIAAPAVGSEACVAVASGQTIYGLIEARGAYAPAAQEVFTVVLELIQN